MQNFGKIKNTFNSLLVEDISDKTNTNKAMFSKFVKTIRENKVLRTQFNVYYDIEKKSESNDFKSTEFVKESISLMNSFKKEEILEANSKLIKLLSKNGLSINEDPYPNSELHENISKLIFTKKTSNNINSIVESLDKVVSYVRTNVVVINENVGVMPNSFIGNLVVEKFNKKYADLNEGERAVVKSLLETKEETRVELFNKLVSECKASLNTKIGTIGDLTEKEALLNVKEALLAMSYVSEDYIKDISRIFELKTALDD